jgi:DNA ligase-1
MSNQTVTLLRNLASTTSRTEKEQFILDAWMKGERDFFSGCQLAYDILVTFGVKKIPELEGGDDGEVGTFGFSDFKKLTDKLRAKNGKRELSGNAAKEALNEAALSCNAALWNEFYRCILLKDMRGGFSESTVNKILEKVAKSDPEALKYIVPVFSCQLAKDGADEQHAKKLTGKKMLDVKLDGVRLLTILDKDERTVIQYTRNGKQNDNFKHITESLKPLLDIIPVSLVLDGEVNAASFQTLMKMVNRKEKLDASSAKLALFDVIPLVDFKAGYCKMPQKDRHTVLSGMMGEFQKHTGDIVYVVPKISVDLNTKEGQKAFAEFNTETVKAGYEGIMVKDPNAPYETKRTAAWLKVKPFIEVSLTIVGYEEGEKGKAFEGSLGALVCEGEDDGRFIRVNVGSGFGKDTITRDEVWANRDKYMGFIVEVRADVLTKEQNSEDVWSLRFPRFKGFRGTEPGEKL